MTAARTVLGFMIATVAALGTPGCGGGSRPASTTPEASAPVQPTAPQPAAAATTCPQPVDDPGCVWADDLEACQRNEAAFNACSGNRDCRVRCFHDDELDPLRDSVRDHADEIRQQESQPAPPPSH